MLQRRLKDLSVKIGNTTEIVPVFINRKIESHLKHRKNKPNVVNSQCVVYYCKCGLCDMDYTGYTTRHLHQRIDQGTQIPIIFGWSTHEDETRSGQT